MSKLAKDDSRTLTQSGTEVGTGNVTLNQNQADTETPIVSWSCPQEYSVIKLVTGKHPTRFTPRTKETFTGTTNDDTVQPVSTDLVPPAGETEISEMPFEPVVAYNVTQGSEIDVADYDFAANEVTLASDPADADTVALFPVVTTGTIKLYGVDQFGNAKGSTSTWGFDIRAFSDYNPLNKNTKIHMEGGIAVSENEVIEVRMESPHQIVWEDPDYPRGGYVSLINQRVSVTV